MKALESLHTRNSSPRLTGRVEPDQLEEIIRAGLRAPDHGQLRPWKIIAIEGDARLRLGDLFVRAKLESGETLTPEQTEKLRNKPLRAPLVLAVAAVVKEHPKVPEVEKVLSAGALVQNMLLAAHAQGLGAMWRTGSMAYDPVVREGLGLQDNEQLVAFLYIGEIAGRLKSLPDHDLAQFVVRW